jgi:hypothetical protein
MNKVLNESDMPPLWVVRDMARHLKLLRRKKVSANFSAPSVFE